MARGRGTSETDRTRIHRALSHPLRARILTALSDRESSPVELAAELDAALGVVSYHVRVLLDADLVELVGTTPRRGAVQHHYRAREPRALSVQLSLGRGEADALMRELRAVLDKHADAAGRRGAVGLTVVVHRDQ
jgi:DNA-binding transcriptional ArsR family regulator